MALRSDELHYNLQHLNGMLTTHEAAKHLDLSYWHFMHLVEKGLIPGVRVVDRWLNDHPKSPANSCNPVKQSIRKLLLLEKRSPGFSLKKHLHNLHQKLLNPVPLMQGKIPFHCDHLKNKHSGTT